MIALTHYWRQPSEHIGIGIEMNLDKSNNLTISFIAINNSNIDVSLAFVGVRNIKIQKNYSVLTSMKARNYHKVGPNETTPKYTFTGGELSLLLKKPQRNDKIEVCFITEKGKYVSKKLKLVNEVNKFKDKINTK